MAEITLHHLTRTYRSQKPALRGLNLSVREGELLTVVGPSGSGKTTMLRLIAGLDRPTAGEVRIAGEPVNDLPAHRRNVAMVFQSFTLYPHMTVERNLSFGLRTGSAGRIPRPERNERISAAAEALGIHHLLKRRPGELSGGERQRAALAKAMVRRPAAFLFDEPLSNLDLQLRHEARNEIKALQRRLRTTTIHITHDQEEAMMLGDRIAVLHEGELQQLAKPDEIYRSPANAFVARFIGSPAMNLIPGRLELQDDTMVFVEQGSESLRVPLLPAQAATLRASGATTCLLGFRPQALRPEHPGGITLSMKAIVVEYVGEWMDLLCTLPSGRKIAVRTPAVRSNLHAGDQVRWSLAHSDLHLFADDHRCDNLLRSHQ